MQNCNLSRHVQQPHLGLGGVQAELDARMQELRRSEGELVRLNVKLEEAAIADQASQAHLRQLEQRLQDVQTENMHNLEEAHNLGQRAADQASDLQRHAAEELASAK
jgi:hypothetical protein